MNSASTCVNSSIWSTSGTCSPSPGTWRSPSTRSARRWPTSCGGAWCRSSWAGTTRSVSRPSAGWRRIWTATSGSFTSTGTSTPRRATSTSGCTPRRGSTRPTSAMRRPRTWSRSVSEAGRRLGPVSGSAANAARPSSPSATWNGSASRRSPKSPWRRRGRTPPRCTCPSTST